MTDEPVQTEFADVVDFERIPGDEEYVAWVLAGRPKLDGPRPRHPSERHVQDVIPGL